MDALRLRDMLERVASFPRESELVCSNWSACAGMLTLVPLIGVSRCRTAFPFNLTWLPTGIEVHPFGSIHHEDESANPIAREELEGGHFHERKVDFVVHACSPPPSPSATQA